MAVADTAIGFLGGALASILGASAAAFFASRQATAQRAHDLTIRSQDFERQDKVANAAAQQRQRDERLSRVRQALLAAFSATHELEMLNIRLPQHPEIFTSGEYLRVFQRLDEARSTLALEPDSEQVTQPLTDLTTEVLGFVADPPKGYPVSDAIDAVQRAGRDYLAREDPPQGTPTQP